MSIRRSTTTTCPGCRYANPNVNTFCANCGMELPQSSVYDHPLHGGYFEVPDYLQSDVARHRTKRVRSEGAGSGFVTIGLLIIGLSFLSSLDPLVARSSLAAGVTSVILGFWRMRFDPRAMTRAGLIVSFGGMLALGVSSFQGLDADDLRFWEHGPPSVPSTDLTPTPDWLETPADSAEATAPVIGGDVPMFRGNPARTGEQQGPAPAQNPKLAWKFDTRGQVYTSPVIAGQTMLLGSKNGFLYAIDISNGRIRWQVDLGEDYIMRSTVAVDRNAIYIATGFRLRALALTDGAEIWSLPIGFAGPSSPVVVNGFVYVSSQEGVIYAADASTGQQQWTYDADGIVFSSLAADDGSLYFGSDNGDLFAVEARTGRVRWRFSTGGEVYATPAVVDGVVYVSSRSQITYAVDARTGRPHWSFPAGGEASPAVIGETVIIGSDETGVYAVERATGTQLWLFPTGSPVHSSPVVTPDLVIVGSGSTLYAVELATGVARWTYPIDDIIESSPSVSTGMVFVGSRNGYLYAIVGQPAEGTPVPA